MKTKHLVFLVTVLFPAVSEAEPEVQPEAWPCTAETLKASQLSAELWQAKRLLGNLRVEREELTAQVVRQAESARKAQGKAIKTEASLRAGLAETGKELRKARTEATALSIALTKERQGHTEKKAVYESRIDRLSFERAIASGFAIVLFFGALAGVFFSRNHAEGEVLGRMSPTPASVPPPAPHHGLDFRLGAADDGGRRRRKDRHSSRPPARTVNGR